MYKVKSFKFRIFEVNLFEVGLHFIFKVEIVERKRLSLL